MSCPDIELYLIRHAESDWNANGAHLIGGRSNETPLTPVGEQQARRLGQYLLEAQIVPNRVFVSPAVRTVETARIVLETMGLDIEPVTDYDIQEMSQGDWVGRLRAEIYTDEFIAEANKIGKSFKAPGGESMDEVGLRMFDRLMEIAASSEVADKPEVVFIFGHVSLSAVYHHICISGAVKIRMPPPPPTPLLVSFRFTVTIGHCSTWAKPPI